MSEQILKATHQGPLHIGDAELQCAVLEDGTRVISRNAIFRAFKRTKRGRAKNESREPNMPSFIDAKNLQPFIDEDLRGGLKQIEYRNLSGRITKGFKAEILPLICDVYLAARNAGELTKSQLPLAMASEVLVRSLSKIGIVALIDEATGYQEVRKKDELAKLLNKWIEQEKYRSWTKTFPIEFYEEMFKLKGWNLLNPRLGRPGVVGKYTSDIVYKRLAPNLLTELERKNPVIDGHRKVRHHQWLTGDVGEPSLRAHIEAVIAIMKLSKNWRDFQRNINRVYPQYEQNLELDLGDTYQGDDD